MAVIFRDVCKYFQPQRRVLEALCGRRCDRTSSANIVAWHKKRTDHNEKDYEYEVTQDPEEWKYVERLIPPRIVPKYQIKSEYPSGWRPPSENAKNQPYLVQRTKNYMLPVYLKLVGNGSLKFTIVKKIRGDIWLLHEELMKYLEESQNKRIFSQVWEGNCSIRFKGDQVYYCEQFLLSKGF